MFSRRVLYHSIVFGILLGVLGPIRYTMRLRFRTSRAPLERGIEDPLEGAAAERRGVIRQSVGCDDYDGTLSSATWASDDRS